MNDEHFGDLCNRYFLGTISAEEMAELDCCLKGSQGLRVKFAAKARLDTNLRDASSSFKKKQESEVSTVPSRPKWQLHPLNPARTDAPIRTP
ncbi:MAG: hypothetical protein ABF384_18490 [Verrucomicrobiales bacterium]